MHLIGNASRQRSPVPANPLDDATGGAPRSGQGASRVRARRPARAVESDTRVLLHPTAAGAPGRRSRFSPPENWRPILEDGCPKPAVGDAASHAPYGHRAVVRAFLAAKHLVLPSPAFGAVEDDEMPRLRRSAAWREAPSFSSGSSKLFQTCPERQPTPPGVRAGRIRSRIRAETASPRLRGHRRMRPASRIPPIHQAPLQRVHPRSTRVYLESGEPLQVARRSRGRRIRRASDHPPSPVHDRLKRMSLHAAHGATTGRRPLAPPVRSRNIGRVIGRVNIGRVIGRVGFGGSTMSGLRHPSFLPALLTMVLVTIRSQAPAAPRVALVIGNASQAHAPSTPSIEREDEVYE